MVGMKLINTYIFNVHAPTEVSGNNKKDEFYEELTRVYEGIRKYAMKIVMGDMNTKCGREIISNITVHKHRIYSRYWKRKPA